MKISYTNMVLTIAIILAAAFTITPFAGAEGFLDASSCGVANGINEMVYVFRNDSRHKVTEQFELRDSDTIWTGPTGQAKVTLIDNTEIEIDPDTTLHIMEAAFRADYAKLRIRVDRGFIRLKTGAIGLKNPKGIKIITPKNLISPSNCILSLTENPDEEILQVEWMPKGTVIEVYNSDFKKFFDITKSGSALVTDNSGNFYFGDTESM